MDHEANCVEASIIENAASSAIAQLTYRPPYDFSKLLDFLRVRALRGVESVGATTYERAARFEDDAGRTADGWVRVEDDPAHHQLIVTVSPELAGCLPEAAGRFRRMFDVDCDPREIYEHVSYLPHVNIAAIESVRLPGCFEPFETACRAVLGQQVSVKAANKLAERIVDAYGDKVATGIEGLNRLWPTPQRILDLAPIEDAFGALGVIKTRSRVIFEIARMVVEGQLDFGPDASAEEVIERLLAIKGIGPWTANYIAMRALSHGDAFLETDVGVAHALPGLSPKERLSLVENCRPWRSYAVIALWNSLSE